MDWMKPKLFEFQNMEEYAEWLASHSHDIPKAGEVSIFRVFAEDYLWLKIGTGCHKMSDLEPII